MLEEYFSEYFSIYNIVNTQSGTVRLQARVRASDQPPPRDGSRCPTLQEGVCAVRRPRFAIHERELRRPCV